MRPDPFESAIDEQLQSVFPQPEIGKNGKPTIERYKTSRRRQEDILMDMVDKMRSSNSHNPQKKGRRRKRRRGPKVLVKICINS
jgi:hypothetical protein